MDFPLWLWGPGPPRYPRTPWRFPLHWLRVHAFTVRGVILEHAVRCRASFTLPATPARRFSYAQVAIVCFLYLFISVHSCGCNVRERMTSLVRSGVFVWAWREVSTCDGRGGEACSWIKDNISGGNITLTAGKCVTHLRNEVVNGRLWAVGWAAGIALLNAANSASFSWMRGRDGPTSGHLWPTTEPPFQVSLLVTKDIWDFQSVTGGLLLRHVTVTVWFHVQTVP